MANPDITQSLVRKDIIAQIKSADNKARKMAVQRRQDVYRKKAAPYVLERLYDEFDSDTVNTMRKVTSINPAKRIVDEQASLYVDEPRRHWVEADEAEADQLDDVYTESQVNPQLRLANRYFKLHNQAALYVVPRLGKINVRALTPKDYDVIPEAEDPERAFAYIFNVEQVGDLPTPQITAAELSQSRYLQGGQQNLTIADKNDAMALNERYVWWTADYHFTTDGNGLIIGEPDEEGFVSVANPIGRLPVIDVAYEKDFRFFVDSGSDVVDFTIDLAVQLSDLANTMKFQAYSQAIISSTEEPHGINIGPNRVIHLKIDPNAADVAKPDFKFESPSPDLNGSLEIINAQIKMFLTSQGLNPGVVTGRNEVEKFASGIDHLLANLDKFKASREDMDLFRQVETELLDVIIAWQDLMFEVNDDKSLFPIYKQRKLSPDIYLDLVFHEPEAVQTDSETLAYVKDAMSTGLMSRIEAVKRIYKVDDASAEQIIAKIDAERAERKPEPAQVVQAPTVIAETQVEDVNETREQ